MKKLTLSVITIAMASMLSACGGSGDGGYIPTDTVDGPVIETPTQDEAKPALTGYFGHKVENLRYRSVSATGVTYEGRTGSHGEFRYNKDNIVTFFLGDFELGSVVNERFVSPALFDDAIAIMSGELPTINGFDLDACKADAGDGDGTGEDDSDAADVDPVDLPVYCVENFPESGVMDSTKVLFSALFDANRDVDAEILDDMYIDKDEAEVAEGYFDGGTAVSDSHDYLTLLSRHSLAPKAGKYASKITADTTHGSNNGTLCLSGDVSLEFVYSDSVENNSGNMSIKGMVVNETPVYGYSELRSRNIDSKFSFVPEPFTDFNDPEVENDFTYNISLNNLGELIGSYTDNINGCSGTITPVK